MIRQSIWQLSIAVMLLMLTCSAHSDEPLPASDEVPKASDTVKAPGSLFTGTPIKLSVTRDGARQSLDEEVLSIVIADLIEYKGKDAVAQAPMDRPEKIYLDKTFEDRYAPTKEGVLKNTEKNFGRQLRT